MKKLVNIANRLALEVFRLFVYFATIAGLVQENVNIKWLGATYKFITQALFTWVESAPFRFISEGMKVLETYIMWFLDKFSFQEIGMLLVASIVARIAVRLVIECDKLFNRARIMYKRRQQQKAQQMVNETAEAKFYARNAVSMTKLENTNTHA